MLPVMKTGVTSLILLLATAGAAAAQDGAGIMGKWTLNREQSDDLAAKIKVAAGSQYMSGGPSNTTEGTWLPWGGAGNFSEAKRLSVREFLLAAVPAFAVLEIRQRGQEIQTTHGDSAVRNFNLARKSAGTSPLGGETVKREARLDGKQLALDSKGGDGRFRETLTLEGSGDRLVYVLRLEQKLLKDPLEARLVYDRAR